MNNDDTTMGGDTGAFKTTYWSMFEEAHAENGPRNQVLVEFLIKRYWKPVYCYLRCRGVSNEQAKDLTQGFFHEVVIKKDLVKKADPSKGRFRTFLLTALSHYHINEYKKEKAKKRHPEQRLVSLDSIKKMNLPQFVSRMTPEDAFTYTWVSDFLEDVLNQVGQQLEQDGKEVYWKFFQERLLKPITTGQPPESLQTLCQQYHVESTSQASNMMTTVKRRLQKVLRERLRSMVISDEELEDELYDIRAFLPSLTQF